MKLRSSWSEATVPGRDAPEDGEEESGEPVDREDEYRQHFIENLVLRAGSHLVELVQGLDQEVDDSALESLVESGFE